MDKVEIIGANMVMVNTPELLDALERNMNNIRNVIDGAKNDCDHETFMRRMCYAGGALTGCVTMLKDVGVIDQDDVRDTIDVLARELGLYDSKRHSRG